MIRTLIISAFPACGKSFIFKNNQHQYSSLDSDSSEFSWVKDENGNNTKERNPDFPNNYIKHIKDNIGKVDVIFVSSHKVVREAMDNEGIPFITVVPSYNLKEIWKQRMMDRGNDDAFIDFIYNNWDEFIKDIIDGVMNNQLFVYILDKDSLFLSVKSLNRITNIVNGNPYCDDEEHICTIKDIAERFNEYYESMT